jgi:hypothetical protein
VIGLNVKGEQGVLVAREGKRVFAEEVRTISATEYKSARFAYVSKIFYATLNV